MESMKPIMHARDARHCLSAGEVFQLCTRDRCRCLCSGCHLRRVADKQSIDSPPVLLPPDRLIAIRE